MMAGGGKPLKSCKKHKKGLAAEQAGLNGLIAGSSPGGSSRKEMNNRVGRLRLRYFSRKARAI
jgi:hypothetical protein